MSTWNWISSIASALAGFVLFVIIIAAIYRELDPDPFRPLEVFPIIIDTPVVNAGGMLITRDGFCNKDPEKPRIVDIYAYIQILETDEARADGINPTIDILGTNQVPENFTLYRCLGTEPVKIEIPERTPPGDYRLTVEVETKGRAGQIQNEVRTSEVFQIVSATAD